MQREGRLMRAFILDFDSPEEVYADNAGEDSTELDGEFADEPQCGLRTDGTCAIADSDYCFRLCPLGNAGGPG